MRGIGFCKHSKPKGEPGKVLLKPPRDAQFGFITETCGGFLSAGESVIAVDTQKKQDTGSFKKVITELLKPAEPDCFDDATLLRDLTNVHTHDV